MSDQSRARVYTGAAAGLETKKTCSKGKVEGSDDEFGLKDKTCAAHSRENWEQKKGKVDPSTFCALKESTWLKG